MSESTRRKLVEYFRRNLKKGYTADSLKWALISQGYSRAIVDLAEADAHREIAKTAPVLKEKPEITYEILDEHDNPIDLKRPWWKRLFGLS